MNNLTFPLNLLITLVALILVSALAWFTLKFLAGLSRNRLPGGRMQVLESKAMGSRERIVIVKVDENEYVLGVTSGGISVIDTLASRADISS